nr:hypothetical protein [Nocardia farcinica]
MTTDDHGVRLGHLTVPPQAGQELEHRYLAGQTVRQCLSITERIRHSQPSVVHRIGQHGNLARERRRELPDVVRSRQPDEQRPSIRFAAREANRDPLPCMGWQPTVPDQLRDLTRISEMPYEREASTLAITLRPRRQGRGTEHRIPPRIVPPRSRITVTNPTDNLD